MKPWQVLDSCACHEASLTNLFGAGAKEDKLPEKLMTPLNQGPTKGSVPDMELMMDEFYNMRGLTKEGVPSKEILRENNLEDLEKLLYS